MNKRRIMLVEDEKVVAADIQECVKGLGYEVVGAAATGTEALRLAVKTMPDLVLMDIKLKGVLDGIDVAGARSCQGTRSQIARANGRSPCRAAAQGENIVCALRASASPISASAAKVCHNLPEAGMARG